MATDEYFELLNCSNERLINIQDLHIFRGKIFSKINFKLSNKTYLLNKHLLVFL